jgi:hypothetical protein
MSVLVTMNCAVVQSPCVPLKRKRYEPPRAFSLTMKLQPEAKLPPETEQVRVYGGSDRAVTLKETDVSSVFQPDPVTVTVLTVPSTTLGESVTLGPVPSEKVLYAYGPDKPLASLTVIM